MMDSFTVIEWLLISSACPKPTIERAFKVPIAFSIICYSMSFFEKFSEVILPAVYLGAPWRQTSKLVTIICSDSLLNISLYMVICVCIYSNLQCTLIGPQEVVKKPTYKKSQSLLCWDSKWLSILFQVVIHSLKLRMHLITYPKTNMWHYI